MIEDKIVLCGANSYEEKYYLNEDFAGLPEQIKQELQIMCVLYTADIGGVLMLEFEEDGTLLFNVQCDEMDLLFDDIGSQLKIKELQASKRDLLQSLEMYYKVFFLGEEAEEVSGEE